MVKSLVDRIHQRYRVSVAETGFHDLHQRAEISMAVVANGESEMDEPDGRDAEPGRGRPRGVPDPLGPADPGGRVDEPPHRPGRATCCAPSCRTSCCARCRIRACGWPPCSGSRSPPTCAGPSSGSRPSATTKQRQEAIEALRHARGFLRTELAHRLRMRATPELVFELDRGAEHSQKISDLLESLNGRDESS